MTVQSSESREEREGSVAAGIFRFAHGRERGLESAIGKDQEQQAFSHWLVPGDATGAVAMFQWCVLKHEQT